MIIDNQRMDHSHEPVQERTLTATSKAQTGMSEKGFRGDNRTSKESNTHRVG